MFSGAALESMVGKPTESMGPGGPFKTQNSPTAAPPNQVSYSYKPSVDMNACAIWGHCTGTPTALVSWCPSTR